MESISQINLLQSTAQPATSQKGQVIAAIKSASERSGVDFSYLLNEAMAESSLNPTAKAKTSSATGLYQFVDQTWLRTVKDSGARHGLGDLADKIEVGRDGIARTHTHEDRRQILALRNDPKVSANMAAELAKSNKRVLARKVGGDIGATELYMAHFLGAGGASRFLNKMNDNPDATAAELFPSAAKANKNVFYDRSTGAPKSVSEVYAKFAKKFDTQPAFDAPATAYAQAEIPKQSQWHASIDSEFKGPAYSRPASVDSAPFTTMLMAQMDMDSFALDAQDYMGKIGQYDQAQRRSVYETLAQTA